MFTLRSSRLRPLAGVAAAAVLLVVIEERKGGPNVALFVTMAATIVAAGAAYAVEDDAAVTVAPVPTTLLRRRLRRLVVAACSAAAGWLAAAAVAVAGSETHPMTTHNAVMAATAAGLALAVASAVDRRGFDQAGLGGTVAGVLLVLGVTVGATKYHWLPSMVDVDHDARWLVVAGIGWVVAVWMTRDPAFRVRRTGRGLLLSA